jgi:sugar phosphate permease
MAEFGGAGAFMIGPLWSAVSLPTFASTSPTSASNMPPGGSWRVCSNEAAKARGPRDGTMSDQDAVLGPLEASRSDDAAPAAANPFREKVRPYAYYALVLLVLANFLNYVDRQIVSILAQSLKAEFGLTDAQLGFLLGTAFAVLYGVVGIAIGRISDAVTRTRLLAFGLALWSAMTVVSAVAMNYAGLAAARIGVGVGEASASPTAQSLLTDYFPARQRATALGVYLLGTSMGGVGALLLGGSVLQHWGQICWCWPC